MDTSHASVGLIQRSVSIWKWHRDAPHTFGEAVNFASVSLWTTMLLHTIVNDKFYIVVLCCRDFNYDGLVVICHDGLCKFRLSIFPTRSIYDCSNMLCYHCGSSSIEWITTWRPSLSFGYEYVVISTETRVPFNTLTSMTLYLTANDVRHGLEIVPQRKFA